MGEIRRAADAGAASWLVRSGVDWWDLVRYGPPGFPAYVRVAFQEEPGNGSGGVTQQPDAVRAALAVLVEYTSTPDQGHAAVWEGWQGRRDVPEPDAPRLEIPNRPMLLFTGPVTALRETPTMAWYGTASRDAIPPHLLWPQDQAWCLACEVDEELEFTVGCTRQAARALARALSVATREVPYGANVPLYRDDV